MDPKRAFLKDRIRRRSLRQPPGSRMLDPGINKTRDQMNELNDGNPGFNSVFQYVSIVNVRGISGFQFFPNI